MQFTPTDGPDSEAMRAYLDWIGEPDPSQPERLPMVGSYLYSEEADTTQTANTQEN